MGGQRIHHGRTVYVLPADFPERLKAIQKQSGLPWAEIARRIGTYPFTVWRWYEGGVRPHYRHQMALLELADELGLAHLLTSWTLPDESESATSPEIVPPKGRSPGGTAARDRGGRNRRD